MTDPTPRLGRCKDCDFVLFIGDPSQAADVDGWSDVKADGRAYRVGNNGFFSRCPNRHKFFPLKAIKGTYSKDHKCDARCLNAKGHNCTCSCGGANHGRGYAVEVREAAAPVLVNPCAEVYERSMATDKQSRLIRALLGERDIPAIYTAAGECEMTPDDRRERAYELLATHQMTIKQASATITWLLTLPKLVNA